MLLAQLLLNGVALGAAYALVALGFVLVLNATSAVNFAHGDTVMAGGFLAVAMASLVPADLSGLGLLLLPGVLVVMAAFGLVLSWLAYMPLRRQPPVAVFISTIAVGIILGERRQRHLRRGAAGSAAAVWRRSAAHRHADRRPPGACDHRRRRGC